MKRVIQLLAALALLLGLLLPARAASIAAKDLTIITNIGGTDYVMVVYTNNARLIAVSDLAQIMATNNYVVAKQQAYLSAVTVSNDVIFPGTGTFRQKRVGDGSGSALVHRWEQGGLNGSYEWWDAPYSASNKMMAIDITAGSSYKLKLYRQGGWVDTSNYEAGGFEQTSTGLVASTTFAGTGLSNSAPFYINTGAGANFKFGGTVNNVTIGAVGHSAGETFLKYRRDGSAYIFLLFGGTTTYEGGSGISIAGQNSGGSDICIGLNAKSGLNGVTVGMGAGDGNQSGNNNTVVGYAALAGTASTSSGTNVAIGASAMNTTGATNKAFNCIAIGYKTGFLAGQTNWNAIAIGVNTLSSNATCVIGSITNPVTRLAVGGSNALHFIHGLNTASNAAVNVGTNLYSITTANDEAGTNATLQVDVLAKTLKIQGTSAKSITNTWYSHDATGATMVTNIQVFTQGILTSWKQNGTEL